MFCHHLQKPIEDHCCKDEESFLWILWSLFGIKKLGCPYFERDIAHKHRFTKCWPNIVKWLNAILDAGHFYGEENQYFAVAGEAFKICLSVREGMLLDNDGVLELAVRIWIGVKASDGTDQYSARPLLACLMVSKKMKENGPRRIEQALCACDIDANRLTNRIIVRLNHATFRASPKKASRVITLTSVMAHLVGLRQTSLTLTMATIASAGRALTLITKAFIDDTESSTDHIIVVRHSLTVIFASLLFQTIEYAISITKAGIFGTLLKLASFDSKDELQPEPLRYSAGIAALSCLRRDGRHLSGRISSSIFRRHAVYQRLSNDVFEEVPRQLESIRDRAPRACSFIEPL